MKIRRWLMLSPHIQRRSLLFGARGTVRQWPVDLFTRVHPGPRGRGAEPLHAYLCTRMLSARALGWWVAVVLSALPGCSRAPEAPPGVVVEHSQGEHEPLPALPLPDDW